MTQEDKDLLLKDLCARLQYGIKLDFYSKATDQHYISTLLGIEPDGGRPIIARVNEGAYTLCQDHVKPYLRPMSSMTDEEKATMDKIWIDDNELVFADPDDIRRYKFYDISIVDFLNKHHFDYRGLIEKGLALEAPEGMYKFD